MTSQEKNGALPSSVTDAVLVHSSGMPEGAQKVEELDFNKFAGRQITVDDLIGGMNNMGFQASSIGEAVRIINNMVHQVPIFSAFACPLTHLREHGEILKLKTKPLFSSATPQILYHQDYVARSAISHNIRTYLRSLPQLEGWRRI